MASRVDDEQPTDSSSAAWESAEAAGLPTASIVVADHNETRAELYEMWLSEYEVRVAGSLPELVDSLEPTTGVVVLSVEFSDHSTERLVRTLRDGNPARQIVVTADDPIDGILDVTPDAFLVRPLHEAAIQSAVEELHVKAVFGLLIGAYYSLTVEASAREVADADGVDESTEYEQLVDGIGRIQTGLGELTDRLSEADKREITGRIGSAADAETRPAQDDGGSEECGCTEELQAGTPLYESTYWERIASFVWKCSDCGATKREQRSGNPEVAKRYRT